MLLWELFVIFKGDYIENELRMWYDSSNRLEFEEV